ncbi:MAG: dihydroorotase [Gammaproteobacteria bacterium]
MKLVITRPDDWHLHLRDGARLISVVGFSARQMARAIIMPNLPEPITTLAKLLRYREEIMAALPNGGGFMPLMTLYLHDDFAPDEIRRAAGFATACKWYPAGATTHSLRGVRDIRSAYPALEAMREANMPLLVHGEVTDGEVDVFDREAVFVDRELRRVRDDFPELKIVLEHISTRHAADFVRANDNTAATITAHHLLASRNDMLAGGIRPHYYCAPILKTRADKEALRAAAADDSGKFFLGSDSAPHMVGDKESSCGCAGVFTANAALELYATAFDEMGKLDKLEAFAAHNGADFYQMARNAEKVALTKEEWQMPQSFPFGGGEVIPFMAGKTIPWRADF